MFNYFPGQIIKHKDELRVYISDCYKQTMRSFDERANTLFESYDMLTVKMADEIITI